MYTNIVFCTRNAENGEFVIIPLARQHCYSAKSVKVKCHSYSFKLQKVKTNKNTMAQLNTKTPAMVLQEFTVKHGYSPPEYVLVLSKTGTHENEFHYKVTVANVCARGFGRSKQVAKHDAATKALEILADQGLYDPRSNPAQEFHAQSHRNESDSPLQPPVNFIGTLKDICCEYKLPYPQFTEISDVGPAHCREFTYECSVASIRTQATANTKKQAKQLAARDMFDKVKDVFPFVTEHLAAESNALMDKDQAAITKYNELLDDSISVIPNRAIQVEDYSLAIKKVMIEKELKFEDFKPQLEGGTEKELNEIFTKLDIKCKIGICQESPYLAYSVCSLDTPFTAMGMGSTEQEAKANCVKRLFDFLETFMIIPDEDVLNPRKI